MPIKKSAKKYLRASKKRATQNSKIKKTFRDAVKKVRELAAAEKIEDAKKMMPAVQKALDKAAKSGVIKKVAAARKKSRLVKMIKKALKIVSLPNKKDRPVAREQRGGFVIHTLPRIYQVQAECPFFRFWIRSRSHKEICIKTFSFSHEKFRA